MAHPPTNTSRCRDGYEMSRRQICLWTSFLVIAFFADWWLGVGYYFASGKNCRMNPEFQVATKELARKTVLALTKANITHWVVAGTLLGGAREKDMIAHDNDYDIAIWTWDSDNVKDILRRAGLGAYWSSIENMRLMRVFDTNYPLDTRFPHVDMTEWTIDSKHPSIIKNILADGNPDLKKFPLAWLGPNQRPSKECFVNLDGLHLPAPCQKKRWLEHRFGANCMTKAIPRWQDCKNAITSWVWGYKL